MRKKIDVGIVAPAAEWLDPTTLVPWARNPRNNQAAVKKVRESIATYGFGAPVVVRRENLMVIAGHTRLKAALELKLATIPVRLMDVTQEQAEQLALADNRLGEIADWDNDALRGILSEMNDTGVEIATLGWDTKELLGILNAGAGVGPRASDDAPDLQSEIHSEPGVIYELGPHRVLCGDSWVPADLQRVIAGEVVGLVWTDPPYGVNYEGKVGSPRRHIADDDLSVEALTARLQGLFEQIVKLVPGGTGVYVAGPTGDQLISFVSALRSTGIYRQQLIWVKDTLCMGRGDYHNRHESIFYGWVPGAAHRWFGGRKLDTCIEVPRPKVSKEHPTMKPIELIAQAIRASSLKCDLVLDTFGGSGSTLMACAQEGRRAALIEKEPMYCDVIRRRWTKYAMENRIDPGKGALT